MHLTLSDLFFKMQQQLEQNHAVLDEKLLIELVNHLLFEQFSLKICALV